MNKIVLIIIALFVPPLAVFFQKGFGKDFVINLLLSVLFLFPGILHALYLLLADSKA